MKRVNKLFILFFIIVFVITGCSTKTDSSATSSPKQSDNSTATAAPATDAPTTTPQQPVEIHYWRHDYQPENDAINKLIATFEKKYPYITVKMDLFPYADYATKLKTALAGGSAPDVIAVDNAAAYAQQGALMPLDSFYQQDGNFEDLTPGIVQSSSYKGHIWVAPLNDSNVAMFYNRKLFEANGIALPSKNPDEAWTWDQVLAAAKKITNPAKGIYGWDPGWGLDKGAAAYIKPPLLWQSGGDVLSPDGLTATGYLDSPASKKALTFFQNLYNVDKVSPKEAIPDAFVNGKVAIVADGPWSLTGIPAKFPNFKLGSDWDVAPLWKDAKQAVPSGSWGISIYAKAKHSKEAWMFINWVTGVEGSKVWYTETKNLPARKSTFDAFPELKAYPLSIFAGQTKYSKALPSTPASGAINDALGILFDDIAVGGKSVDVAVNTAVKSINDGIAKVK